MTAVASSIFINYNDNGMSTIISIYDGGKDNNYENENKRVNNDHSDIDENDDDNFLVMTTVIMTLTTMKSTVTMGCQQ